MKKALTLILALVMIVGAVAFAAFAEDEKQVYLPQLKGDYIVGMHATDKVGTKFADLTAVMPRTIIEVTKKDGTMLTSSSDKLIGTGDTVRINGKAFTAVVCGDVDGNGKVEADDYIMVKRYYLGTFTLTGASAIAAGDDDLDGAIKAIDYVKVKRHVLATFDLAQEYLVPESSIIVDDNSGWTESWI